MPYYVNQRNINMVSGPSCTRSNVALDELSDVEATIHFTDNNDLRRRLDTFFNNAIRRDSNSDHTVLVTGFPSEGIVIDGDDDDEEESPIPKHRKALYLKHSKMLVLMMKSCPYQIASKHFFAKMALKLKDMNRDEHTLCTGGVTVDMEDVIKEADESWGPRHSQRMTCALETAVSESNRALNCNARIWLEHPESHVTQVITIRISKARPEIVFSVWKATHQERATGSQHPTPRAILDHEVYVTLAHGRPIAEGTLRLSFEKFFERPPRAGTAERDIVFSVRDLGWIAEVVWEHIGFIPLPRSPA